MASPRGSSWCSTTSKPARRWLSILSKLRFCKPWPRPGGRDNGALSQPRSGPVLQMAALLQAVLAPPSMWRRVEGEMSDPSQPWTERPSANDPYEDEKIRAEAAETRLEAAEKERDQAIQERGQYEMGSRTDKEYNEVKARIAELEAERD